MSYTDEYIDYLRVQKRYSSRTQELYRRYIDEFSEYCVMQDGEDIIMMLKRDIIRGFIASGMDSGLSSATINLKISAISGFCRFLVKRGHLKSNPVDSVPRPKKSHPIPEFYTQDSLLDYFNTPLPDSSYRHVRNRMVVSMLYTTGMRRAELASLTIGDVDFDRLVIRVCGKGDKMREIPVEASFIAELKSYLEVLNETFPDLENRHLFLTNSGQPFYLSFVNKVVKEELQGAAGILGKKSPHKLRHSIATHLLNNGADLNSIKEVLGHSSLAATQVYTHNSFEQLKKAFLTAHPRAKKGGNYGH